MRLDRDRIRQGLSELVAIPSITGSEVEVQDHMAATMAGAGLEVERIDADPVQLAGDPDFPGSEVEREVLPVVVGRLAGSRSGPSLLLMGHVDVVPAGDPATWTTPPFVPAVRDGNLYGRGACDMKGGVVAMIEAVRAVAEAGTEVAGTVTVVTVPSEEDGGSGALAAIRSGLSADMAVIPEPTRLEVVIAHAGAITFTLEVPGRAAHASTRGEGVSALDGLGRVLAALEEDERVRNEAETHPLMRAVGLPYPTIIGKVSGGEWASTVIDRLVVEGRYGVKLGQSTSAAAEDLRRALEGCWEADPFLRTRPLRVQVTGGRFGSTQVPIDHPLPTGLADAAERVTGRRPPSVGVPYGADMRLIVDVGGIPCVMFGPGDVRVAHAADEHVALDDVEIVGRTLAEWILATLG